MHKSGRILNTSCFFFPQTKTKKFDVAEYVLPNFEVTIDATSDFTIKDRKIRGIVRAKYTYGKNVKGRAIVSLKYAQSYGDDLDGNYLVIKTVPINGKAPIEFDLEREVRAKFPQYSTHITFNMNVMVIEDFTGRNTENTDEISDAIRFDSLFSFRKKSNAVETNSCASNSV